MGKSRETKAGGKVHDILVGDWNSLERLPHDIPQPVAEDFARILSGVSATGQHDNNLTYAVAYPSHIALGAFEKTENWGNEPGITVTYFTVTDLLLAEGSINARGYKDAAYYEVRDGEDILPPDSTEFTLTEIFQRIKLASAEFRKKDTTGFAQNTEHMVGEQIVKRLWARNPFACLVEPYDVHAWSLNTKTAPTGETELEVTQRANLANIGECLFQTIRRYSENGIRETFRVLNEEGVEFDDFFEHLSPEQQMRAALFLIEKQADRDRDFSPPRINSFGGSVCGRREENEDYFLTVDGVWNTSGWHIVGDGLGGHTQGAKASKNAVETITSRMARMLFEYGLRMESPDDSAAETMFQLALTDARDELRDEGDGRDTTITASLNINGRLHTAHLGDCRLYFIWEDDDVSQITEDHNYYAKAQREGKVVDTKLKSVVYRTLGASRLEPVYYHNGVTGGMTLLYTTDGFHGVFTNEQLPRMLKASDRHTIDYSSRADYMNGLALYEKTWDNSTFIAVELR